MAVFVNDPDFTLHQGDALDVLRGLPDGSVHCVVTSPPYWALRDYQTPGQLGLEETPDEYVARMVDVFREVRRVLRNDGTLFLNLGDSYVAQPAGNKTPSGFSQTRPSRRKHGVGPETVDVGPRKTGDLPLKPKDLVGIPWRVAFALQADGWYLRSDIIWSKPNPMPESVTDRPTKAHEYVFLLSKRPSYFFDQEAVREPHNPDGRKVTVAVGRENSLQHRDGERWPNPAGRNVRSVWTIATQPYPEAHFATFPEELARRCILAGSSEKGCCPECGAPWERVVERTPMEIRPAPKRAAAQAADPGGKFRTAAGGTVVRDASSVTTGWRPSCGHGHPPAPCTILDPFMGSGTVAHVARLHGRRSVGIELNPDYCALAAKRLAQQSLLTEGAA